MSDGQTKQNGSGAGLSTSRSKALLADETEWDYDENTCMVRVPLWQLMRTFGRAMYMGCSNLPFERNEITLE